MHLHLDDDQICARVSFFGADRVRLSVTYPRLPKYRNRVMKALADLIRPASATQPKMRHRSLKQPSGAPKAKESSRISPPAAPTLGGKSHVPEG